MTTASGRPGQRGLAQGPGTTAEFRRLGKRGSYRLGQLRAQGIAEVQRPVPFQPQFARVDHRVPIIVWVSGLLAGTVIIAAAAARGFWFAPFAVGVPAGLASLIGAWRQRVALPAVVLMAAIGWGAPLAYWLARGHGAGTVPRLLSTTLGVPRSVGVAITLTVLIAVVQALAGYWVGRALTPRPLDD